ncbi:MAG: hypothetical protein J6X70_08980 [Muribaculaceae bacterium]|nr:hypothetical protein [Muribaculaceae bacterium]
MKKVIFSMVVATVAAFSLAAQDTNDAAQPVVPIEEQTELACDKYVLTVPEGFKATSRVVNRSCNMGLQEQPYVTVAPYYSWYDAESFKADLENDGYEALDDITVGDATYQAFYWLDEKNRNCQHVKVGTPHGDGTVAIHFFTGYNNMETDEVKEALMNAVHTVLDNFTIKK